MLRNTCRLMLLLGCVAFEGLAGATTVTINTDAARAVLVALQDPALSHQASLQIAAMRGNQGIIRKLNEFKIPATAQSFADALYAAAHGAKVTDPVERSFYFDIVKPKSKKLLSLLQQVEDNPLLFQGKIEKRIALFAPSGADIHLHGYIVAGGDGGGYAFGDPNFFLNIGFVDEIVVAEDVTTHEMYHAVQGAFAEDRVDAADGFAKTQSHAQNVCFNTNQLFANLYEEGSATYVENISLLSSAQSELGQRKKKDFADGLEHVHTSVSLLEMSVISLSATDAMPYDDVYDVGFYGHGILYTIGYVMAKDIVDNDGPQGLAAFLKQPPYRFVLHYTQLPKYGADKDHPRLGPNTFAAVCRLANYCK